jgi:hypothetical protein
MNLRLADEYEDDDYTRIEIVLHSSRKAWVYISKKEIDIQRFL